MWLVSCGPRLVAQSCLTLCNLLDCVAHQAPLSMGFPSQEYWSWFSFPSPAALADPGIKPASPVSPELQVILYPCSHWGSPQRSTYPIPAPTLLLWVWHGLRPLSSCAPGASTCNEAVSGSFLALCAPCFLHLPNGRQGRCSLSSPQEAKVLRSRKPAGRGGAPPLLSKGT